jgi:protein TonB
MIASAGAHLLFAATIVLLPSLRSRPKIPDAFFVDIVAPQAPPAPVRAAPPAPAPQPVTKPPSEPSEEVRVETKAPEKVDKPPEKKPREDPPPRPVTPPPEPAGRETGETGAAAAEGIAGEGSSVAPMEGGDSAFAWYRASVTAALYSQWRQPVLPNLREPLEVAIAFEIRRDGGVLGPRISQTSGVPSLDRSALRAVADASPLPPLPRNWREPTLPATFLFRLYPEDF